MEPKEDITVKFETARNIRFVRFERQVLYCVFDCF